MEAAGAWLLWPARDPEVIEHDHRDLSRDHPHLVRATSARHAHAFAIDTPVFGQIGYWMQNRWRRKKGEFGPSNFQEAQKP
jgi:hypothetical protein